MGGSTWAWRRSGIPANFRSLRCVAALSVVVLCGATPVLRSQGRGEPLVFRDRVDATWLEDGEHFWYRNALPEGTSEFLLVDAAAGTRSPAFDAEALAASLSAELGEAVDPRRLPFERIEFPADRTAVRFKVGERTLRFTPSERSCTEDQASAYLDTPPERGRGRFGGRGRAPGNFGGRRGPPTRAEPLASPDGHAAVFLEDSDVWIVRSEGAEGTALSTDGEAADGYESVEWSPDSSAILAWRLRPVERKEVYLVRSSPPEGGRAVLETRGYSLPGDPFPTRVPHLFDAATGERREPAVDAFEHEYLRPRVHWRPDGHRFDYDQTDRGHQRFRIFEIDAHTAAVRTVLDEVTDTFHWTAHAEAAGVPRVTWLERSDRALIASERSGWRHLSLLDLESAEVAPVTQGEWVVRGLDFVDEEAETIWYRASGRVEGQDPYFVHSYRVDFSGADEVALTDGDGDHEVGFSPDRRFAIDTYSRVDRAPVTELRRCADGAKVLELERADASRLLATGWQPPQVFVAKGRDGVTDIWGIVVRPKDHDPAKRYPIVEDLYAGPHDAFVPKRFRGFPWYADLTERGLVVVKVDGMGTAHRGKAFHDVCWQNLEDAGFPDRISWMQALGATDPSLDLERVGVYGTSAGGQSAVAALIHHHDFYKVAVANCGCHDNRMDKASWNEQWMGYPVGPQYSKSSNVDQAAKLEGDLFLIVGELDTNVPPESTYRLVDALIKANKDFDFLMVPGADHGARAGNYTTRRTNDFLARHLLGQR